MEATSRDMPVEAGKRSPSLVMVALTVVLSVVVSLCIVGWLAWVVASSRGLLPPVRAASPTAAKPAVDAPSHVQTLDPMLINLADAGGAAYLRVAVALRVADSSRGALPKPLPGADAQLRDILVEELGRQRSDVLVQPDGKAALKRELLAAMQHRDPQAHVLDVYFTDFLVQR